MNKKYHGSRVEKSGQPPKRFALLLALALILVATIGGTVAFLTTHTGQVKNTFTPGEVSCEVKETVQGGVKSSVKVQNTGNTDAYIRVAVVANTVDGDGNVTGMATLPDGWLNTENWQEVGGYYYYKGTVAPEGLTAELLTGGGIDLKPDKQVTILASAIQSSPAKAVNDAWRMSFSNGSWSAASGH